MQYLRALAALLALFLAGCGSTFHISGAVNPDIVTTTGTVSFVHVSVSSDGNGTMVNVTVVTLLQASMTQTLTFCGSQMNQFPMNSPVKASFTPGTICATLVAVEVTG